MEWKAKHPNLAATLQQDADQPTLYCVSPHERVYVVINGESVEYNGTIRALAGAPSGACTGKASPCGSHPYTCDNCNALIHGKSSVLRSFIS